MIKNTASDDLLRIVCRPPKGTRPALIFYLRKKHGNAVLRNYVKRAARGKVLKIQDQKKIDIQIFSLKKFTWKDKTRLAEELEKFAFSMR